MAKIMEKFSTITLGKISFQQYQCKGLLPSLSGTSGSAFHFVTM